MEKTIELYGVLDRVDKDYAYFIIENSIRRVEQDTRLSKQGTIITEATNEELKNSPSNQYYTPAPAYAGDLIDTIPGYTWPRQTDGTRKIRLDKSNNSFRKLTPKHTYIIKLNSPNLGSGNDFIEEGHRVRIEQVDKALTKKALSKNNKKPINKVITIPNKPSITKDIIEEIPSISNIPSLSNLDILSDGANPTIVPIPLPIDEEQFLNPESYTRIGYTRLLIPPQSIVVRDENGLEVVQVLRNQGSLKAIDYNTRIMIDISFTVEGYEMINEILIPIINQFRRTPFLPIENLYLNYNWGVDGIALRDLSITTVDGLPNVMSITLVCEPFNWKYYLSNNNDFSDSFCWPLFKVWCEDRSKCIPLKDSFNGILEILIPNKDSIDKKIQLSDQPSLTTTAEVLNDDVVISLEAKSRLDANIETINTIPNLQVVKLDGRFVAITRFQTPENVLKALNDNTIKVYSNIKVANKNSVQLIDEITSISKRDLINRVIQEIESTPNSKDNYEVWFVIPQGSTIWSNIIRTSKSKSKFDINITDFDSHSFSQESVITNISVQMSNILATNQVQNQKLPQHQYIAGADMLISIQGMLYGEDDVSTLKNIIEKVRSMARNYRPRPFQVPYLGYMKINNEVIQSLGIQDVIPITLNISNTQGFPHVFNFQLDLIEFNNSQEDIENIKRMENDVFKIFDNDNSIKNWKPIDKIVLDKSKINKSVLKQNISEDIAVKIWRSGTTKTRMRMQELYPDMRLPTKKEIDYWILLLQYWLRNRNSKDFDYIQRKIIDNASSLLDENNMFLINNLVISKDPIGFAEPDFYCIPSTTHREDIKSLLDINLGKDKNSVSAGSLLMYDQYGAKYLLSPGNNIGDPEAPNTIITKEDIAFREYQKKRLQSIRTGTLNDTTPPTSSPVILPRFGLTVDQSKIQASYKNNFRNLTPYNSYDKNNPLSTNSISIASKGAEVKNISNSMWNTIITSVNEVNALTKNGPFLDPGLVAAVIVVESGGKNLPSNSGGYIGLMQLSYKDDMSPDVLIKAGIPPSKLSKIDLRDETTNLKIGIARLKGYLEDFGNPYYALAAHRAGAPSVRPYFRRGESLEGKSIGVTKKNTAHAYSIGVLEIASYINQNIGRYTALIPASQVSKNTKEALIKALKESKSTINIDPVGLADEHGVNFNDPYSITMSDNIANKVATDLVSNKLDPNQLYRIVYVRNSPLFNYTKIFQLWHMDSKVWENLGSYQTGITDINNSEEIRKVKSSGKLTESDLNIFMVYTSDTPTLQDTNKLNKALDQRIKNADVPRINNDIRELFHDLEHREDYARLVRAFPSYSVLIIDGGRWIGVERLWNQMYGGFGINSIETVQSRESPVDVATITFSNLYGKLTALAADIQREKSLDTRRQWSIDAIIGGVVQFFAGIVTKDLEIKWNTFVNSMMLKPGARLHIRLGYSSDANKLQVKFNGVISEVPVTDKYVQIVAIGDGAELIRPIPESDPHMIIDNEIDPNTPLFQNTGIANTPKEPRNIIAELFQPESHLISSFTAGRWFSDNPYGIIHFGSVDYSSGPGYDIGECGVNLYSSSQDPENDSPAWINWIEGNGLLAHLNGSTLLGIELEKASPWEIVQTCRKAIPDFICQVRPFEFRSTLYIGKPWWPFYYEYQNLKSNPGLGQGNEMLPITPQPFGAEIVIPEFGSSPTFFDSNTTQHILTASKKYTNVMNSKPFSQFHIIASGTNLLASNITASEDKVFTNCQAKYIYGGVIGTKMKDGDIQQVDSDIFQERKKTKIIKSGLLSGTFHGFEGLSSIMQLLTAGQYEIVKTAANTCAIQTLRDDVASMYQGSNLIIGDPYINPWDFVYLQDLNNLMSGLYQAREVVNHFSMENGYVTTVSPDCCVAAAGNYAPSIWMAASNILFGIVSSYIWKATTYTLYYTLLDRNIKNTLLKGLVNAAESNNIDPSNINKVSEAYSRFKHQVGNSLASQKLLREDFKILSSINKEIAGLLDLRILLFESGYSFNTELLKTGKLIQEGKIDKSLLAAVLDIKKRYTKSYLEVTKKSSLLINPESTAYLKSKGLELDIFESTIVSDGLSALSLLKSAVFIALPMCLGDIIGRYLTSRQTLVIFPLRVNNLELSAGINGHQGAVVGDPMGTVDLWLSRVFSGAYYKNHPEALGSAVPFLIEFLFPGADPGYSYENVLGSTDFPGLSNNIPAINKDGFDALIERIHRTVGINTPIGTDLSSTANPNSNIDINALLKAAQPFEGLPYTFGGEGDVLRNRNKGIVGSGIDCSAFVQQVFLKLGITIPRTANLQYKFARPVFGPLDSIQTGDLVFLFGTQKGLTADQASHVGIYLGNNQVMAASSIRGQVVKQAFNQFIGRHTYKIGRIVSKKL